MRRSTIATVLAVFAAAGAWAFFDQAKHNAALASHAGFLDDPYDAVGSVGIQIGALAAAAAVVWLLVELRTHTPGWQSRATFVTGGCCLAIGVADLVGQALDPGLQAAGPWLLTGICLLIASGLLILGLSPNRRTGRGPSLLAILGTSSPAGRQYFASVDRHPFLTAGFVGVVGGSALVVTHQLLEGGPDDFGSLILLSAIYFFAEGLIFALGWLVLGGWLKIHSGVRLHDG